MIDNELEVLYSHKNVTYWWNDNIKAIESKWKDYVRGEEYRNICNKLIDLIEKKNTSGYLMDITEAKVLSEEDQQWIGQDWTPRALKAGLKYIAVIVPASILTKMSLESLEQHIGNMEFRHFNNYDEARSWLKPVNK